MALLSRIFIFSTLIAPILFFTIFSLSAVQAKDDPQLVATLDSPRITIDETAVLRITVDGSRSADIEIPEVEGLSIERRGQSSQIQMINGTFSSSITTTFVIQPLKEGKYTLPPFRVTVDDTALMTEKFSLEVSAAESPHPQTESPPSSGQRGKTAFITVDVKKNRAYTGEIVPVEVKAYFLRGVRAEIVELPVIQGDAFVLTPLDNEPPQSLEQHEGSHYSVLRWQSTLTPIKEGHYDLSFLLNTTLLLPQKKTRSRQHRSPFFDDDFFDGFFDSYQKKNVALTSSRKPFTVLPLPKKGRPENFSGAVGNFDLHSTITPSRVNVGDPITLRMTITGEGNFDRVQPPPFPEGEQWRTYTPSSVFTPAAHPGQGEKIFEQAIVANSPDVSAVPSLAFSYFDPQQEQYVTVTTPPIPIDVAGVNTPPAAVPSSGTAPREEKAAADPPSARNQHSANIRLDLGSFVTEIKPVYTRSWFIAAASLLTVLLTAAVAARLLVLYTREKSAARAKKRKKMESAAQLERLRQHAESDATDTFMKECRALLQFRLGSVVEKEPGTITPADLQSTPLHDSVLYRIFQLTEEYHYGGTLPADFSLKKCFTELHRELEGLP